MSEEKLSIPGVMQRNFALPLPLSFLDLHQTQKQQDEIISLGNTSNENIKNSSTG